MFLITEDDLKQASMLTESSATSKKDKRDAERKKKVTGGSAMLNSRPHTQTHTERLVSKEKCRSQLARPISHI